MSPDLYKLYRDKSLIKVCWKLMKLLETRHQIKSGLRFLPYNNNSVLLLLLPLHRAFQLAFLLIPLLVVESPPLLDHKTLGWSGKDKKTYSAQRYTILTCIAFVRVNLVSEALFGDTAPQPNPPAFASPERRCGWSSHQQQNTISFLH